MESSCSTPSSSRTPRFAVGSTTPSLSSTSRLPMHLQQPSSSTSGQAVYMQSVHHVRPGQSYVTVQTLSKETHVIVVDQKTRVHDVLWKCGEILEINEDKLFGLALRQPSEGIGGDQPRHEYHFLDPSQKIFKYAPKQSRFSNWHSKSSDSRPLLVLFFRVRVYIDNLRTITCPQLLEHYYLQMKDNYLDQWASRNSVAEERCWEMASLALRADKGEQAVDYFRAEQYFPLWVIDVRGLEYIRNNMPSAMEDLKECSRQDAMRRFCQEASRSPFALNGHLYGLRRHKMDSVDNAVLGINAKGIEMCDIGEDGDRIPLRQLAWNKVTRLAFDKKKITIVGEDGTKMSLYAHNESKARYLLELCRSVHQTLIVFSHRSSRNQPFPQTYFEKSVDRLSTSSNTTSGVASGENEKDNDSLLHGSVISVGDRNTGSVSSRQRLRIKMDSNLDLKIERMELDSIRQERATSQSSKASTQESEERSRKESTLVEEAIDHLPTSFEEPEFAPPLQPPPPPPVSSSQQNQQPEHSASSAGRPSSVDSASPSAEASFRPAYDVNFNTKLDRSDQSLVDSFFANSPYNNMPPFQIQPDLQYPSSGGSRSDSVRQSNEMLPEMVVLQQTQPAHHEFVAELPDPHDIVSSFQTASAYHRHHELVAASSARSDDADSTLRSVMPPQKSSISLHDLRSAGMLQPPPYGGGAMMISNTDMPRARSPVRPRWTTVAGFIPVEHHDFVTVNSARSEPKMDSELWAQHPSMMLDQPESSGGRRFTKRPNSGAARIPASINRVHSMPAHYHHYIQPQRMEDCPPPQPSAQFPVAAATGLHHAQSMNQPRAPARDPPSYERVLDIQQRMPTGMMSVSSPQPMGPLPAEAAGGQPAFPPASATAQFGENFMLNESQMNTERLRNFPMMHRLWKERETSHQRRPSSCLDLTEYVSQMQSEAAASNANGPHRGEYVLERNFMPFDVRPTGNNNFAWRPSTQPIVDLPPPPPYPAAPRKAPMVM